jgi:hypothetical protein
VTRFRPPRRPGILARAAFATAGALAIAIPVCGIPDASAAPNWVPLPVPGDQTLTGICQFPVFEHWVHYAERATYTTMPDGTIVENIQGADTLQVTNVNTGTTLQLNVSGPGTMTTNPDGSGSADLQGINGFPFGPNPVEPPYAVFYGHLQYTFAAGAFTSFSFVGHVTDECAALS